jgi:hypothetical protein
VSTNDAYLDPARPRPNLVVRGGALVDRVSFAGRRAVGVRLADGTDLAAREVIISAGAIHSPAILLRSGIGTEDRLPVGANLKDHAATPGFEVALLEDARMPSPRAPCSARCCAARPVSPTPARTTSRSCGSARSAGMASLAGGRIIRRAHAGVLNGVVRALTEPPRRPGRRVRHAGRRARRDRLRNLTARWSSSCTTRWWRRSRVE